jgi:hypothetical protein
VWRSYSPNSVAVSAAFSGLVSIELAICWFLAGRLTAGAICVVVGVAFVGLIHEIGVSIDGENKRRSLGYAYDRAVFVAESMMVLVSAVMCLVFAAKGLGIEVDAGLIVVWYFVLRCRAHRAVGRWRA